MESSNQNVKRIKRAQVHLALHPDMMEQVKVAAKEDGRTVTNWIERVINEALKARE